MAVLTVTNLEKSYGPVEIFSGVTFSIPHRARAAIVGPNGIGKTTLLRIFGRGGICHQRRGASVPEFPIRLSAARSRQAQ